MKEDERSFGNTDNIDPALFAAVMAAIIQSQNKSLAVAVKRADKAWVTAGRLKLMDSRL